MSAPTLPVRARDRIGRFTEQRRTAPSLTLDRPEARSCRLCPSCQENRHSSGGDLGGYGIVEVCAADRGGSCALHPSLCGCDACS